MHLFIAILLSSGYNIINYIAKINISSIKLSTYKQGEKNEII